MLNEVLGICVAMIGAITVFGLIWVLLIQPPLKLEPPPPRKAPRRPKKPQKKSLETLDELTYEDYSAVVQCYSMLSMEDSQPQWKNERQELRSILSKLGLPPLTDDLAVKVRKLEKIRVLAEHPTTPKHEKKAASRMLRAQTDEIWLQIRPLTDSTRALKHINSGYKNS